jgi:NhaA family Na+:H+ antiporter
MAMNGKLRGALDFIRHEAAGASFLLVATLLALALANSPLNVFYDSVIHTPVSFRVGSLALDKTLLHWVNDGLMAIFFLLVGLEIKREFLVGELSSTAQASMPFIAALGGMVVPGLIYFAINADNAYALRGWAIPTATDIAFAVGVMSLLGSRVPPALKVFLLALAIIDDLGAIVIIAVFYTSQLSMLALSLAAVGVAALVILNRQGVMRIAPYILIGIFIWLCVLKSGVHATLAGVVTALAIPLSAPRTRASALEPPAGRLQHNLHPWVTFAILPLFAFANAGVSLGGLSLDKLTDTIPLGIALGLLVGKPVGVLAASAFAIAVGVGRKPEGTTWTQMLGAGLLAGIGFTMSLFIGNLAFPGPEHAADIRIGVLAGSILAAIAGYLVLAVSLPQSAAEPSGRPPKQRGAS